MSVYTLHQAWRSECQAYRFGPKVRPTAYEHRQWLGAMAEQKAATLIADLGHKVTPQDHNDRCDLVVDDGLRVEVKASRWTDAQRGSGRYQALWHNEADLVAWYLVDADVWYVIPTSEFDRPTNVAIWSRDPDKYTGRWSVYQERWDLLSRALPFSIQEES